MSKILRRLTAMSLVMALTFGIVACAGDSDTESTTTTQTTTTTTTKEDDASKTPEDTETEDGTEDTADSSDSEEPVDTGESETGNVVGPDAGDVDDIFVNDVDNSAIYPIETDEVLTYWADMNTSISANFQNLADTPLYQEYMRRTGVQVEFQHPGAGQGQEQLSLMLTTGEYPDLIETDWATYTGGPNKAIQEQIILEHNEIFEKYAPNLMAYLEAHPDKDRMVKTDEGQYFNFPFIQGHENLQVAAGIIIRHDWLNDLGLEIPVTMDDWYHTLTAFKNEKGATAPMSFALGRLAWSNFSNPYGVGYDFYLDDDGELRFGPMEEGYREWLTEFHKWYSEGLIDADIATLDNNQVVSKMSTGQAGASMGFMASGIGVFTNAARETNPDYLLAGAPTPVLNEGDPKRFGQYEFGVRGSVAITTNASNIELAARFLDYAYSNEGHILMNFGIEGESFEWDGTYPRYTDAMYNDPLGRPISEALGQYVRATYNGPFVQDKRYIEQYVPLPEQKEAYEIWADTNAKDHFLPPITATAEESTELATIMSEVYAERDRMFLSFLLGTESLDGFDDYVETLKDMGIERAIEIQKAALERFYNR